MSFFDRNWPHNPSNNYTSRSGYEHEDDEDEDKSFNEGWNKRTNSLINYLRKQKTNTKFSEKLIKFLRETKQ